MGFRSVALALAAMVCLSVLALGEIPLGPKNYEPTFPAEDMSGNEIYQEVREGVYANDEEVANNAVLSFRNESLFYTSAATGMTPGILEKNVRTPVVVIKGLGPSPAAGSWSFNLRDTVNRYLTLNLYQTGNDVFGYGELTDGGVRTQVTAGGTVLADMLSLYVIPTGSQSVYRFNLDIKPGSMDGSYVYSSQGVTQPGVAFGSLWPAQSTSAAVATQIQPSASQQVAQQSDAQQPGTGQQAA